LTAFLRFFYSIDPLLSQKKMFYASRACRHPTWQTALSTAQKYQGGVVYSGVDESHDFHINRGASIGTLKQQEV